MALAASNLLRGRIVAITGASQGIGRGIALGCAQAGAQVVVHHLGTDQTTKDARELVRELDHLRQQHHRGPAAIEVPGDISDPKTADHIVDATVAAYGRLDGLVSNAGVCPFFSFLDIPHDVWRSTRSINLDGAFYVVQAAARQMRSQSPQGGAIVAVSSISALVGGGQQACVLLRLPPPPDSHEAVLTPTPTSCRHYTPTKAGVKSLMESCAISLSPYKIRCASPLLSLSLSLARVLKMHSY